MKFSSFSILALSAFASPSYAFLPTASQQNTFTGRDIYAAPRIILESMSFKFNCPSRSVALSSTIAAPETADIDLLEEAGAIFRSIDSNKDNVISAEELRNHLVERMGYSENYAKYLFNAVDMDSNGEITKEELQFAFYNLGAIPMYMTFGVGGSEVTNSDAFRRTCQQQGPESRDRLHIDDISDLIFDMLDVDSSGEIDKKELLRQFEYATAKCTKGSTEEQAKEYVQTMFATLDINNDGVVSRQEMRDALKKYDYIFVAQTLGLRMYNQS